MPKRVLSVIKIVVLFLACLVAGFLLLFGGDGAEDPIRLVPFTRVRAADTFRAPRMETNRTAAAPFILARNEETLPDVLGAAVLLVPYFAWANRGPGEMRVWFKRK